MLSLTDLSPRERHEESHWRGRSKEFQDWAPQIPSAQLASLMFPIHQIIGIHLQTFYCISCGFLEILPLPTSLLSSHVFPLLCRKHLEHVDTIYLTSSSLSLSIDIFLLTCNSHGIKFTFSKGIVVFSRFTWLCNHHQYKISERVHQ